MFSTRPGKEHSVRKRWISHVYSKSHIHTSPAAASQARTILFSRLLPIIESSISSPQPQPLDVHSLFLAATMDFISSYVFGLATATNFLDDLSYREHWLELYKSRNNHGFYDQELPRLTAICRRVGIPFCPRHVDQANAELGEWCMRIVRRTHEMLRHGDGDSTTPADQPTVLAALLAGMSREEEAHGTASPAYRTTAAVVPREKAVASELFDHVLAGQETAGVALTYLTWRLSRDLGLQRRLREELLSLEPNVRLATTAGRATAGAPSLPDPKALDSLPLLQAVVMETLRLHAPIPGPQPRITPPGGCLLGRHEVPGGVRVAALAYALHRDERIFPEPDEWDYTRWMDGGDATTEEMRERKRAFWAFSSGGRMCIGSNFAMHG